MKQQTTDARFATLPESEVASSYNSRPSDASSRPSGESDVSGIYDSQASSQYERSGVYDSQASSAASGYDQRGSATSNVSETDPRTGTMASLVMNQKSGAGGDNRSN